MSTRPPVQVWRGHTTGSSGEGLDDLGAVIRRYTRLPGARLMTRDQVPALPRPTPLERTLAPASHPQEAQMGKRNYDPDDPENAPLTPEERRLDEIQERGLRERQADQERAGRRFDLFADSEWGTDHGNL